MRIISPALFLAISTLFLFSCKKDPATNTNPAEALSYGTDPVFFVKSQDYVADPNITEAGTWSAFPDDLKIDNATGRITITKKGKSQQSQAGMKYKITFTPTQGEKDSTYITIAGVNYQDRIYTQNNFMVDPILNASFSNGLPSGTFSADRNKLEIDPVTGQIDLKKTIQNGFFGGDADNEDWREVTISYKTNDNPNNVTHNIDLIIYYYDSVSDIPSNVSTVMRAHQQLLLGIDPANIPVTSAPIDDDINDLVSVTKPRPPCIIIVGQ